MAQLLKRAEIIVKGDVQRVGYRDAVERIARKLNIKGYVENLIPYKVKIIAEGEEDIIKEFIKKINIQDILINVEEINVSYQEPTNEFEYFEIRQGDWEDEIVEKADVIVALLSKWVDSQEKLVTVQEKMFEKWELANR